MQKYAKASSNGISTRGAGFSTSSNGVSAGGGKVVTQSETFSFFFFPSLTTFPAAVMLFERCNEKFTCGVGVVTLVRM